MATAKIPTLDQYWEKLAAGLLPFSPEEQRAAVTLYRELTKGQPVDATQTARAMGVSPAEARELLARDSIKAFIYPDEQGRVVGFGGLAAAPMHHRMAAHCGPGARGTACLFRRSWANRRTLLHRIQRTASSFGSLCHRTGSNLPSRRMQPFRSSCPSHTISPPQQPM